MSNSKEIFKDKYYVSEKNLQIKLHASLQTLIQGWSENLHFKTSKVLLKQEARSLHLLPFSKSQDILV